MRCMWIRGLRRALGAGALLVAAGCATPPSTPEERAAAWLAESPRTLALQVEPDIPAPRIRYADRPIDGRRGSAAEAAGGAAVGSIAGGCAIFPPFGCVLGLVAAPFVATGAAIIHTVGTPRADSAADYRACDAPAGVAALCSEGVVAGDIAARLNGAALAAAGKPHRAVRLVPGSEARAAEGELFLGVEAIDLVATGSDLSAPDLTLSLAFRLRVTARGGGGQTSSTVAYESERLPASEWRKDGSRRLREEIAKAVDSTAAGFVTALDAPGNGPPGAAAAEPPRAAALGAAAVNVGDRWDYAYVDTATRRRRSARVDVAHIGPGEIFERVAIDGGEAFTLRHGSQPSLVSNRLWQEFSPYLAGEGAAAGAGWEGLPAAPLADCRRDGVLCALRGNVVGVERVATAGGEFDAVKVVLRLSSRDFRLAVGSSVDREFTYWYSARAKRLVKATARTLRGNTLDADYDVELTSYSFK